MRRLQIVVNPSAGRGRAARLLPAVQAALRTAGHDVRVSPTRSLAHAAELAEQAVADERVAVAMGGDGTVGRVAAAVAAAGGLLGVLPGGRGNDFCRAAGIPRSVPAACEVLTCGVEHRVDLGVVTSAAGEAPFLGIASIGFDSAVQERVLRSRLPIGPLVYRWAAVRTVAGWRHATYACVLDGQPLTVHGWAVAVANSGVYGGGMRLAPQADLADGRLDVVCTAATSRLRFLRVLPKVLRGTHVHEPAVSVRRAGEVELAADRPFRVFADGDPVGSLPATVTVRPSAVRVLLPRR